MKLLTISLEGCILFFFYHTEICQIICFCFISKEMLCLGSQSRPAWGLMGHIIGARIGPRQLPLLHPLLSALIQPPQIIWTHCWPGQYQSVNLPLLSNLSTHDGDFPSTTPIFRDKKVKRRILTKHRLYAWYVWTRQHSFTVIFKGWVFCQWNISRNFYVILLTIQPSNVKPTVWRLWHNGPPCFCGSCW